MTKVHMGHYTKLVQLFYSAPNKKSTYPSTQALTTSDLTRGLEVPDDIFSCVDNEPAIVLGLAVIAGKIVHKF